MRFRPSVVDPADTIVTKYLTCSVFEISKNDINNQAVPPQNDVIMNFFFFFESASKIPSHATQNKT